MSSFAITDLSAAYGTMRVMVRSAGRHDEKHFEGRMS